MTDEKLNDPYIQLLAHVIKARIVTAWIVGGCATVLLMGITAPLFLGERLPPTLYVFLVACSVLVIWSIALARQQYNNRRTLSILRLHTITTVPKKIGRAVTAPTGGATHLAHLTQGVVRLEGASFGTIPDIFEKITENRRATFLIALLPFGGIKGVIVDYRN